MKFKNEFNKIVLKRIVCSIQVSIKYVLMFNWYVN